MIDQKSLPIDVVFFTTPSTQTPKKVTGPFLQVIETFRDNAKSMWTEADDIWFQK
jgi:hypothetical protein